MNIYCDILTKAGMSQPLIPAVSGKTIAITAIAIQNESTTDVTLVLYTNNKEGSKARRRICMPNKGDGFDRVYLPKKELKSAYGGDFTASLSVDAQVGLTIEYEYL